MADAAFSKLVPGFDFLQGLVKNAGSALPSIGQWVAPTLDPQELEKRIDELRTVQFWLEQNARMLATTIQALEVQRMTLSTLKTMNVQLGDLRESMKIKLPEPAAQAPTAEPEAPARKSAAKSSGKGARARKAGNGTAGQPAEAAAAIAGAVDPVQWWGALTKQFTDLAANAMKDSATDAAKNIAGAMVKQSVDAAGQTIKNAVGGSAKLAAQTAGAAARKRAPRRSGGAA